MSLSDVELKMIEYEKTIFQLRNQINNLEEQNRSLKYQCGESQLKTNTIHRLELNLKNMNDLLSSKDDELANLRNEHLKLQKDFNDIRRATEIKYEKELKFYKALQETNTTVVENANMATKLNEIQHRTILQLENKIDEIHLEEERAAKEISIKHENQFTNLKKKMMDHIKVAQKNMAQANLDNMDLNTKLSKLTTNQLLIELEEQSLQIEELLRDKEKLQKTIFALKTDVNTHKKVAQLLQEKNQKYHIMIKTLNEKNSKLQLAQTQTQPQTTEMKQTISSGFNLSVTEPNTNEKAKAKKRAGSHTNYEELYHKKSKDYENLKGYYECLKDKEKNYEVKYSNIMKIYQKGFEELLNDPEFRNKKDLNVNSDVIQNGDYVKLNKEQQYTILIYLIKHLFPLIQNPDDDVEEFKNKVDSINLTFSKTQGNFRHVKNNSRGNMNMTSKFNFRKQFPLIQTISSYNSLYHQ